MTLVQVASRPAPEVFARLHMSGCTELLVQMFTSLVGDSFVTHSMRNPTNAEIARRTNILERWLRKLCDGQRWPIDRALHCLRIALRKELDGEKYEPPTLEEQVLVRVDDRIEPFAAEIRKRVKAFDLAQ